MTSRPNGELQSTADIRVDNSMASCRPEPPFVQVRGDKAAMSAFAKHGGRTTGYPSSDPRGLVQRKSSLTAESGSGAGKKPSLKYG
jgi:hypothetical protein